MQSDLMTTVDQVGPEEWHTIIKSFRDTTIYQTWPYGAVRWGQKNISHLVVYKQSIPVAAAQVRIVQVPALKRGVAYITWGPLLKARGRELSPDLIRYTARALVTEYAIRRRLLLRVRPPAAEDTEEGRLLGEIFEEQQLEWKAYHYRTILIDLSLSEEALEKNLRKHCRKKIKTSRKADLTISMGTDDAFFENIYAPYRNMLNRKQFTPGMNIDEFREIQLNLPSDSKMNIMVASMGGKVIASLLASVVGETGIFILGGNDPQSLKTGTSNRLPWEMILWMKQVGARWCDMGGYNPDQNPGTAFFKEGYGGIDVRHVGEFEACYAPLSRFAVWGGEKLNNTAMAVVPYFRTLKSTLSTKSRKTDQSSRNAFDVLKERGFIDQTTHDENLRGVFERPTTCYVGFDPTAGSLHVGHLLPIMALAHLQRCGHCPIVLVGGETAMIGDPSGKTEMRQMLSEDQIAANVKGLKKQLSNFFKFDSDAGALVNNSDWLSQINYIDFLRGFGSQFSVNRMLKAETYRSRHDSEEGLNFIEFNYMVLQAYDFLHLHDRFNCTVQMGGRDQWGNIIAGIELIRRLRGAQAYGITFPLVTNSSGAKMGKTAEGAVWLDAELTPPPEYYNYWLNQVDRDIARFMKLFTFLPLDKINKITSSKSSLARAKSILAYEATKICHGIKSATLSKFRK